MQELEPLDVHRINAACGWLELGNPVEARLELEAVSPEAQSHPAVLDTRWAVLAAEKNWDAAYEVAQQIIVALPEHPTGWLHCAYALRRKTGGSIAAAMEFLEPAAVKFPQEPVIAYNLACYAAQLNRLSEARDWYRRARKIGDAKSIKEMALADEDLKPLWPEIKAVEAEAT